jgi:hypothetical protein
MLPLMVFSVSFLCLDFLRFMKSLQNIVEEIWLDKSGNEVRIIYRNRSYRQFRGAQTEEKLLNSAMISPAGKSEAMAGNYKIMLKNLPPGHKFPEVPPFDEREVVTFGHFWRKYYITRRNYYLIAKVK